MAFKVKACSEVWLALSQVPGLVEASTYQIGIGVGQQGAAKDAVQIYSDGDVKRTVTFQDILKCDEFSEFWISWENGFIKVI